MNEKLVDTSSQVSVSPRSLAKSLQERMNAQRSPSKSPAKSLLSGLAEVGNPFLDASSRRGRSHVRVSSPVHQMTTRSRSKSMSRGTYLQWTRAPHSIIGNFFMAGVDEASRWINKSPLLLLTGFALLAVSLTLSFWNQTESVISKTVAKAAPFTAYFSAGVKEAFGFGSFNDSLGAYFAEAATFMYGCRSGNISHGSGSRRFRCSGTAVNSKILRLLTVTAPETVLYAAGSIVGSFALFAFISKCRHNVFFVANPQFRKAITWASTRFAFIAALPNFIFGFDVAGLVAGFAGLSNKRFFQAVLIGRMLFGLPARIAWTIFSANKPAVEMALLKIGTVAPVLMAPMNRFLSAAQFIRDSETVNKVWKYASWTILAYFVASVVKAIANTRAYNRFRRNRLQ